MAEVIDSEKNLTSTYSMHGLFLHSEIKLDAPVIDSSQSAIEVYKCSPKIIPKHSPDGELLQIFEWGNESGYASVKTESEYIFRFFGNSEFHIDFGFKEIRAYLNPDKDSKWISTLLCGNVCAMILMLMGKYVLHASAVQIKSQGIAFVAGPGMGKSTLAALFCLQGASLITDDVLHIDSQKEIYCYPGTRAIRLKQKTAYLAQEFEDKLHKQTIDKRISVQLASDLDFPLSLSVILIPLLSHTESQVGLRRLSPSQAFLNLSKFPRILGIKSKDILRSQFEKTVEILENVPVYEVIIPWKQPLDLQLPTKILKALGEH